MKDRNERDSDENVGGRNMIKFVIKNMKNRHHFSSILDSL